MSETSSNINWTAIATDAESEVNSAIEELSCLIKTRNRLEILSRTATYILGCFPDEHKERGMPEKSETHLEYLCSLATALPISACESLPTPREIQRTIELLTTIHVSASVFYMAAKHTATTQEEALLDLAASFRLNKLNVRGDGYWHYLKETWKGLLTPHDQILQNVLGFTSEDFFKFTDQAEVELQGRIDKEQDVKISPYCSLLRPWMKELLEATSESDYSDAFLQFERENGELLAAAKVKFDTFGSPYCFAVTPTTRGEAKLLDEFSCSFGDNSSFVGAKQESRFWPLNETLIDRRPFICHQGVYYSFLLPKIQRGAYELFSLALRDSKNLYWQTRFLPARDQYLEDEVAALFKKALPGSNIYASATYATDDGNGLAEADMVILIDDFLIITECKAGAITPSAKRGGHLRVKTDVDKTIAQGLNQAERLVKELVSHGELSIQSKDGKSTILKAKDFRWIFRINVTLDLIASIATEIWGLCEMGLLESVDRCWSVSLNDLRVIVHILNKPALFLHYLIRRFDTNVLRSVDAVDELDYLMRYVLHGLFFRGRNSLKENEHLRIVNYTSDLDQYYRRTEGFGSKGSKPRIALGAHTDRFIELLQKWRPKHWMTASTQLLEFDRPDRETLLGKIPQHFKHIKNERAAFAMSVVGCTENSSAIVLATAQEPAEVVELVEARCLARCKEMGFSSMCVILVGIPISSYSPHILCLVPGDSTDERAAELLRQLRFQVTEYRKADVPEQSNWTT